MALAYGLKTYCYCYTNVISFFYKALLRYESNFIRGHLGSQGYRSQGSEVIITKTPSYDVSMTSYDGYLYLFWYAWTGVQFSS